MMNDPIADQISDMHDNSDRIESARQKGFLVLEIARRMSPSFFQLMASKVPWWAIGFINWERFSARAIQTSFEYAVVAARAEERFIDGINDQFPCQCDECQKRRLEGER